MGGQPAGQVEVEDFLVIPFLLAGTRMAAILQRRVAERLRTAAGIKVLPVPLEVSSLGIDMVWNPRARRDAACVWLREQLLLAART